MPADLKVRTVYTTFLSLLFCVYFLLNRGLTPTYDLSIYIDNLIPFSAPFGLLYFSYLLLLGYGVGYAFFEFDICRYKRFVVGLIIVQLVAYLLYVLIPAKIIRPEVHPEGFFFDVVRMIYALDMPSSQTPSLHVANSWFIALALWNGKYLRPTLIVWASLIIASTLFIKQHFFIDVVSGLALSSVTYAGLHRYHLAVVEEISHGTPGS